MKFIQSSGTFLIGLLGLAAMLLLCSCANKEDTDILTDILSIPFRIIGM